MTNEESEAIANPKPGDTWELVQSPKNITLIVDVVGNQTIFVTTDGWYNSPANRFRRELFIFKLACGAKLIKRGE